MSNLFDTANAPTKEPTEIIAGNYISWKRSDLSTDYPNTQYSLSYEARLEGSPARQISISAAADGDDYLVELDTATTQAYDLGKYHWTAFITRTSDSARISIDEDIFTVKANKASSAEDPRSFAEKMVDQIKAAIEHRADNYQLDTLAYSLGVESSATRDTSKLLEWLVTWEARVIRERRQKRARQGKSTGRIIRTRF